jgi:hypothetical protein
LTENLFQPWQAVVRPRPDPRSAESTTCIYSKCRAATAHAAKSSQLTISRSLPGSVGLGGCYSLSLVRSGIRVWTFTLSS